MSYNEENKIKFQGDVFMNMKCYEMMDNLRGLFEKCEFIANFNKKRFIEKARKQWAKQGFSEEQINGKMEILMNTFYEK